MAQIDIKNIAELLKKQVSDAQLSNQVVDVGEVVFSGDGIIKVKETKRQATLSRDDRLKNLKGAFRVKNKKEIKDKTVLIVDDVTTTGATGEAVAEKLKKAGAKAVYLLTVASLPPKDKY